MTLARNFAIVAVIALAVAFVPAGGDLAAALLTAITMAFLAAITWTVHGLAGRHELTLSTLGDSRRAILYGAVGLIVLLVAGSDEMFSTGFGTLIWIILLGASVAAIWRVWMEANSY